MAGTNAQIIEKAFKGYSEHIEKVVYNRLDQWCAEIIRSAVFERIQMSRSGEAYNITGNLINSICVIMYRKSNCKKTTYFADQTGLKPAIRRELTAYNVRGRRRTYKIRFGPRSRWGERDWSGNRSIVNPDNLIQTDESFGFSDARRFASMWMPRIDCDFVICVAYTSEYANFVEQQRHTTGFLGTMAFVGKTAIQWVGLK